MMSNKGCRRDFTMINSPVCDPAGKSGSEIAADEVRVLSLEPFQTPLGVRASNRIHTYTRQDHWGTVKARFGVGRMDYAVDPGLYALGNPDGDSPVFVSANYKMSFDELRSSLPGRNGWILVLDTDGINVWCAAGKGTFGTDELVRRIEATGLKKLVRHRKLILPQLAGPGVSAHQVKTRSGFTVQYGPIRAQDLPAYLDSGLKATPEMRRKTFTLKERAVLIPVELVEALKPTLSDPACPFSARRPGWSCGILGKRLARRALCGTGIFERPLCRRRVESLCFFPIFPEGRFPQKDFSSGPSWLSLFFICGVATGRPGPDGWRPSHGF